MGIFNNYYMLFAVCFFFLLLDASCEIHADFWESLLLWYEICEYQYGDFLLKQTLLVFCALSILALIIVSVTYLAILLLTTLLSFLAIIACLFFGFLITTLLFFFLSWVFECYIFDLDKLDAEWGVYAIFLPNKIFLTEYFFLWGAFFIFFIFFWLVQLRFWFVYRFCFYSIGFVFLLMLVNFSYLIWDFWFSFILFGEILFFFCYWQAKYKKKEDFLQRIF